MLLIIFADDSCIINKNKENEMNEADFIAAKIIVNSMLHPRSKRNSGVKVIAHDANYDDYRSIDGAIRTKFLEFIKHLWSQFLRNLY
jgi:hypothetical protein